MIDEIDAEFNVLGKPVIFAWVDTIYNPLGIDVPPQLMAHETVHGLRQEDFPGGVEAWWAEYIRSKSFRFFEERVAHQAEYDHLIAKARNRKERRVYLKQTAKRLASPLYGNVVSRTKATALLKGGIKDPVYRGAPL